MIRNRRPACIQYGGFQHDGMMGRRLFVQEAMRLVIELNKNSNVCVFFLPLKTRCWGDRCKELSTLCEREKSLRKTWSTTSTSTRIARGLIAGCAAVVLVHQLPRTYLFHFLLLVVVVVTSINSDRRKSRPWSQDKVQQLLGVLGFYLRTRT